MEDGVRKYVSDARASGMNDADIVAALVGSGWDKAQVESVVRGGGAATPTTLTAPPVAAAAGASAPAGGVKALYNPHRYATIGFFFTIVPVALMSMANGKVLEGGEEIRKKMKLFLIVFLIVATAWTLLLFGSAWYLGRLAKEAISADPYLLLGSGDRLATGLNDKISSVKTSLNFLRYVLGAVNLWILVAAVRLANRMEVPAYDAVKKTGALKKRNPLLPILLGLAIMAAYLFLGSSWTLRYLIAAGLAS